MTDREPKPTIKYNSHIGKQLLAHSRYYGVVVSNFDSEFKDTSSNLRKTLFSIPLLHIVDYS